MEDRPIGAERLKCKIKLDIHYGILSSGARKQKCEMFYRESDIFDVIDNAPTIDPFTHGYWDREKGIHECSVCGYWNRNFFDLDCNYCPSCGAKMDAKTE